MQLSMPMLLAIRPTKKTHTCACLVTARPHPLKGSQRPGPRPGKGCMCILTPAQDGRRKDACIGSLANLTTRPFREFCHGGFLLRVLRRSYSDSYKATLSMYKLSPKTSCLVQLTTRKPARGRLVQQKTAASAVACRIEVLLWRQGYVAELQKQQDENCITEGPDSKCIQVASHPPSRRCAGVLLRKSATAASRLHQSRLPSPPASIA